MRTKLTATVISFALASLGLLPCLTLVCAPVAVASAGSVWYLAEGSTAWGFNTEIAIENPNGGNATARVTYMTSSGPVTRPDILMAAESVTVLNPSEDIGSIDFSTTVECLEGLSIAVDRTMSWMGGPIVPETQEPLSMETHSSIGVTGPANTWYLPEGSSAWGFETWLLIQNPNAAPAECTITYMIEGVGPAVFNRTVPTRSRATFSMENDIGKADASIQVGSNLPVIPERAMYRDLRRMGHESIGATAAAHDYYLAEGSTAWGFTTYVLVQNPNAFENVVTLTYMRPTGPAVAAPFTMPAKSRRTIRVNEYLPGADLSTRVHGKLPLIAERAMYWGSGTPFGEVGHDSIGMASPHTAFYLPGGRTADLVDTWTLVQNPGADDAEVEVSYFSKGVPANNVTFTETIPAETRRSFNLEDRASSPRYGEGLYGIRVRALTPGAKIMCERATYWWTDAGNRYRTSGSGTIGGYED